MSPKHGSLILDAPPPVWSVDADPAVVSAMRVEQAARKAYDAATTRLEGIDAILNPPIPKRDAPAPTRDARSIFEARKNLAAAQFDWNEAGVALEEAKKAFSAAREAAKARITVERRAKLFKAFAEKHQEVREVSQFFDWVAAYNAETAAIGGTPDPDLEYPALLPDQPTGAGMFSQWESRLRDRGVIV